MGKRSDFSEFADQLQQEILDEVKRNYSKKVVEHWMHPENLGKLEHPDGYGRITGPCGDTMEIFLKVEGDIIKQCTFFTDGCGTTIACGSITTESACGRTIEEAKAITQEFLLRVCGGLPPEDEHCALLASDTLMEGIASIEESKK